MSSAESVGSEERRRYLPSSFSSALMAASSVRSSPPAVTRRKRARPGLARFLRTTAGGLLRVDEAAIKAEEKLDGKYLLRSSDPSLSAEDIALGYKQLAEVERGWRDMKQVLELRPVYHRREDRIRAHVVLCWLALLLVRVMETSCGGSWPALRRELEKLRLGSFRGAAGSFRQRSEITDAQRAILAQLQISAPPLLQELTAATS